jgi:hypothetical protein
MDEVSLIARATCTDVPFGRRYASGLRVARPFSGQFYLEAHFLPSLCSGK